MKFLLSIVAILAAAMLIAGHGSIVDRFLFCVALSVSSVIVSIPKIR